jgi:hypothetical protein
MKGDRVDHSPDIPAQGVAEAMAKVTEIMLDGLRHGFFDMAITCEIGTDQKRILTVKSGKSHRFVVPFDQIQDRIRRVR